MQATDRCPFVRSLSALAGGEGTCLTSSEYPSTPRLLLAGARRGANDDSRPRLKRTQPNERRSVAKKEEVENMIASEVAQLSLKLQQERDIEVARAVSENRTKKEKGGGSGGGGVGGGAGGAGVVLLC